MKWSLQELHRYSNEPLHLSSTFDLKETLVSRFPDYILDAQPMNVEGYVTYDDGDATIQIHVVGKITVPSSRSLKPVELPLDFSYTEIYVSERSHVSRYEDNDLVFILQDHQLIDLDKSLVENIFEQIPTKILSPDEESKGIFPSGKGWEVITEAEENSQDNEHVDPRFAKLKNLFPDQDKDN